MPQSLRGTPVHTLDIAGVPPYTGRSTARSATSTVVSRTTVGSLRSTATGATLKARLLDEKHKRHSAQLEVSRLKKQMQELKMMMSGVNDATTAQHAALDARESAAPT